MTNSPFVTPPSRIDKPNRQGLMANVLIWLGVVVGLNGFAFGLGWTDNTDPALRDASYAPPGWLVGSVWTVLFVAMAVARRRLNRYDDAANARWWVSVLLLNCALYPAYTLGLSSLYLGLAGNLLTILLAAIATRLASIYDRLAAGLVSLVIGWVIFATYTIVGQLGWLS